MSERNEQMAAMLAANAPGRDLAFEIAVMAKIEQRRFLRELTRNLLLAAGAALLLAFIMPQFDFSFWANALSGLAGNAVVMVTLLLAAFAAWYFRPVEG